LQDTLYIRIPKHGGTEEKHFEPLSVAFLVFFAMIILIQFVSMLFHRYGTFLHILASTGLHCCSKQYEPVGVEDIVQTVKVGYFVHIQMFTHEKTTASFSVNILTILSLSRCRLAIVSGN